MLTWRTLTAFLILGVIASACAAQVPEPPGPPLAAPFLHFDKGPLTISQPAIPSHPFTVTGKGGAILGMQDGTVELWQFPLKFFSGLHLRAEVDGYGVPIDLNSYAAALDVSPDHTTLTYSHSALTVRQHMFVPSSGEEQGGVIVFEIRSIKPVLLTVSLTPAMVLQWPAPQWGQPGWGWKQMGADGGAYTVATDNPELFGLIGMPGSTVGDVSPYQEHPHTVPLEFRLRFDPAKDNGKMYPLLCETARPGERNNAAGQLLLQQRMSERSAHLEAAWSATQLYYAHFFDTRLQAHTPDPELDKAIAWAELAIDKAQATSATGETGLVAGWFPAYDSARPGFGWYFGRDTLWSLFAIDSYSDRDLAKRALEFLIRRQRADGKMMHEFSQTADLLTGNMAWAKLEYEYAAADATPLYLLAMQDYIRSTGDLSFLKEHWPGVKLAYHFQRTHDSDGDGVYDNSQGTGWVESWPPKVPHQEMYLAALDRDSSAAMAVMAGWMQDEPQQQEAAAAATRLAASVAAYGASDHTYAFSKNANGTFDRALTIYPAVALWHSAAGLPAADTMLNLWSSHSFTTDWGTRSVSETDPVYNPISYHQGTVWPLFTGWNAMAQYRADRPMAGYAALRQNAALTWVQDPGAVTELLSGRFYQPLGRSSSHQLWSSAMVVAPAVRGLFGVEPDAPTHTLHVSPNLPASWGEASLENVRVGDALFTLHLSRAGDHWQVSAESAQPSVLCLRKVTVQSMPCAEKASARHLMSMPLPKVEAELISRTKPSLGDSTQGPRVIDEQRSPNSLVLQVEALRGSAVQLLIRRNGGAHPRAEGGTLTGDQWTVTMPGADPSTIAPPEAADFVIKTVSLHW